jgi:riboflavin synthase
LRVGDALGGHWVTGHVDACIALLEIEARGADQLWRMELPESLAGLVAHKGSVAIDGVSLTSTNPDARGFQVHLIPHTLQHTRFGEAVVGDRFNLEVDVLARYAARHRQVEAGVVPA